MGDQRVRLAAIAVLSGGFAAMLGTASLAAEELAYAGNCALYAREVTGVDLQGNAGDWWAQAEGRYARGREPVVGAILVFRPSHYMPSGHVAIVSHIINKREIQVDQANWIHGRIVKNLWVVDASPNNDWTIVEVENLGSQSYGRQNPTFGFVYPRAPRPRLDEIEVARDNSRPVTANFTPIRFAVASAEPRAERGGDAPAVIRPAVFFVEDQPQRPTSRSDKPASGKAHVAAQSPRHEVRHEAAKHEPTKREPAKHAAVKHEATKNEPAKRDALVHVTKTAAKPTAAYSSAHVQKSAAPAKAILATHKVTEPLE
jgi:surface antigen